MWNGLVSAWSFNGLGRSSDVFYELTRTGNRGIKNQELVDELWKIKIPTAELRPVALTSPVVLDSGKPLSFAFAADAAQANFGMAFGNNANNQEYVAQKWILSQVVHSQHGDRI